MPYIPQEDRYELSEEGMDDWIEHVVDIIGGKGEFTYLIYKLMSKYRARDDDSYTHLSETISAVEEAAHEFRRRVLWKYEDERREEHGDVT